MTKTRHGTVHGNTIELDGDIGIAEGQAVEVQVKVIANSSPKTDSSPKTGDGFLRTEGALADDEEWDAIMEEIYQARKVDRRPSIADLGEP